MSISKQIIFSSTLVGLLALFAGYTGWKNMYAIEEDVEQCMTNALEISENLRGIQGNLVGIHKWFLATEKPTELSTLMENFDQNAQGLNHLDEQFATQLLDIKADYLAIYDKYQNRPGSEFLEELRATTFQGEGVLRKAHVSNGAAIKNQASVLNENIGKLSFWIITICLMIFAMAIIFGQVIARALSKSLLGLENAAAQIKMGNLSSRIDIQTKNEFGYLAKSFNLLAESAEQSKIIENQNAQLETLNKELKVKNDSLDSFVYRVSHDLKAPLINMVSLLNVIKKEVGKYNDPKLNRPIEFMTKNSEKLNQSIQDLLEVSRIEKNLKKIRKHISIQSILDHVFDENNTSIESSQTTFDIRLSAPEIYFSKTNLKSVLSNLISNSIKYRNPAVPNVIQIYSEIVDDHIQIQINDNGLGMDLEKHQRKLFGIFNRFHNHVDGSGVGLYIVKKIVDDNQGTIAIKSEINKGTSVTLTFPVHKFDPAESIKQTVLAEPPIVNTSSNTNIQYRPQ